MNRLTDELTAFREWSATQALTPAELARGCDRLREADAARAGGRLHGRWPLRWVGVAIPAGAAAIALVAALWPHRREPTWYRATAAACLVHQGDALATTPDCPAPVRLMVQRDEIELGAGSALERRGRALGLPRGRARFVVAKRRAADAPFTVHVSHGTITVLGTQFVVEQRRDGGAVRVLSGRVRFAWQDGSPAEEVAAGQHLVWPKPALGAAPASPPPSRPARAAPVEPAARPVRRAAVREPDVNEIMRRLFQLRSQRRRDEATKLLSAGIRRADLTATQKERLSVELGDVLAQAVDRAAACRHWHEHLRRFPRGAHDAIIRRRADECSRGSPR